MPNAQIAQAGIISLVADAGGVAKGVLFVLLIASVLCWAIIGVKWRSLKSAMSHNQRFLNVFWHGKSFEEIFLKLEKHEDSPIASVFESGVKELKKFPNPAESVTSEQLENVYRAMIRTSNAEIAAFEKHINWLATTASAAPFVGLFGTVWGIMNSFQSIGVTGAANLAIVAPGISEALITTAMGIAAAVPAVVAYNHFGNQIKRLSVDMECFSHDFLNIVQRSAIIGNSGRKER